MFENFQISSLKLKSQIRNLRFLPDLAESTNTSARSSWYLWIVPIPSRNCARAVWKFPDVLICCSVIIIRKLKIHMTKIWVDNFYWDVVSACDTAGTSCCSVFIETLGLDFLSKLIMISKFKFQNFDFPQFWQEKRQNLRKKWKWDFPQTLLGFSR